MTQSRLPDAIALRIGVAARSLPGVGVGQLLEVLIDAVGLPLTATKLDRLTLGRLRTASRGTLAAVPHFPLLKALAYLNGASTIDTIDSALPDIESYCDGEMRHSIRVAVASSDGERLDAGFVTARRFLIYQLSATEMRLVAIRNAAEKSGKHGWRQRLPQLTDCHVVYAKTIATPSAAALVAARIHPIQTWVPGPAREALSSLQRALRRPPPWLAKACGQRHQPRLHERTEVLELCV